MKNKKAFHRKKVKRNNPFQRIVNLDSETCKILDSSQNKSEFVRNLIKAKKRPATLEDERKSLLEEINVLKTNWQIEQNKVNDFYQGQIYMKQKRIEAINDYIERQKVERKLSEFATVKESE